MRKSFSPASLSVPPTIDGPAEERVVETISNPVTFACDATGIPPPSLTWLKNGRPIGETVWLGLYDLSAVFCHSVISNHTNHKKNCFLF